jgi:hypothetical protein
MSGQNYLNYPDELVRAVGLVVLSAAWAEDKAGELVTLHHGTHEAEALGERAAQYPPERVEEIRVDPESLLELGRVKYWGT